jgi:Ca2+-binding RTX toxin-like protein
MLKKFGRLKEIAKGGAIAVTSAVLVASVAAACTSIAHSSLDHQPKFTITNTISSSSTTQTPALLYPGVSRYLWYTAHNPLTVPITVTTMSISSVTAPAGCPIVNLSYAATTFTGSLVVPAQGSNSVPVPISLFETHKNQDSCENTTFRFDFQGTATFNVVPSTSTLLSSSHNPSVVGQSVTYTATVVSGDGSGNHHNSNSPTGTVTFKDGSITICSNVPVSGNPDGSSTATCTPPTYLVTGTHPITAVFTNSDGNFENSTSSVLNQLVQSTRKSASILTSWPNPSVVGFPVSLTASVFGTPSVPSGPTATGTVSFYLGTPITSHSLIGTETLTANGKATMTTSTLPLGSDSLFAVYNGDSTFAASTSPVIVQVVIAKPGHCSDTYNDWFYGSPGSPNIQGSSGNNFFWIPSGSFQVYGNNGSNCFWGGDGNNVYSGGNGRNEVTCGNGNNGIFVGNGNDDVQVGDGTNQITLGGGNDTVSVGNGSGNHVALGNGNDVVNVGSGSSNQILLGSGTDDVTIQGSQNTITGSGGSDTVFLGAGSGNTFTGAAHHANVCHLPTPPASWHGTPASYFHDTLTNCTVVSP